MAPTQTQLTDTAFGPRPSIEVGILEDGARLDGRARRAMSSRMLVLPVFGGDGEATGTYRVIRGSGTYRVTLGEDSGCDCPDSRHRDATCKHQRRVAREITDGRVPEPGESVHLFFADTVPEVRGRLRDARSALEQGRVPAETDGSELSETVERFEAELTKAVEKYGAL